MDKDQLERYLDRRLAEYEEEWGLTLPQQTQMTDCLHS